ncbi:22516_t:CDS:2, partial [Gigaspora rosea]
RKKTPNYTNSNDDSNSSNPIARLKPTKRKKVSEKSDTATTAKQKPKHPQAATPTTTEIIENSRTTLESR